VNFGDILDKWEKGTSAGAAYDRESLASRDVDTTRGRNMLAERRTRLLHKKPDAALDLHGLSVEEAWKALYVFFEDSRWRKLEKLLIIHGKGNHTVNSVGGGAAIPPSEAALREITKRFIESCSYAGESGFNPARAGGRGATWVFLKELT